MDPEYALRYRDLYEKHWWWRAREDLILETLEPLRAAGEHGAILDVGCGDGLFFEELSRLGEVEGIETDPTGVTPGGRWVDRIHVRPFDESFQPGKHYGLILMLDVLEHLQDPAAALGRALDLLEPEGTLLITVPAFQILWTSHDDLNHHLRRYSRTSLASLIRRSGGEIRHAQYFYRWLFPFKLAAHFKEALLPVKPATPGLPPRWLNGLLFRMSRLEQKTLGAVPLPFGSSLLAVVRRRSARA